MPETLTERDLVVAYREARLAEEKAKEAFDAAKIECDKTEAALIELMDSNGATSTAKYDGVGYVTLGSPALYANCTKDNEERLFEFLRSQAREDLIKPTVNSRSLSVLVKEIIASGQSVPEFISYYLKPCARLYKA